MLVFSQPEVSTWFNCPVNSLTFQNAIARGRSLSERYLQQLLHQSLEAESLKGNFDKLHSEMLPPNGCKNCFTLPCSELSLNYRLLNLMATYTHFCLGDLLS